MHLLNIVLLVLLLVLHMHRFPMLRIRHMLQLRMQAVAATILGPLNRCRSTKQNARLSLLFVTALLLLFRMQGTCNLRIQSGVTALLGLHERRRLLLAAPLLNKQPPQA